MALCAPSGIQFPFSSFHGEPFQGLAGFFHEGFHRGEGGLFQGFPDDVFAGSGIIQGLVVVEGKTQIFCYGIKFVVFHVLPQFPGEDNGVSVAEVDVRQVVGVQGGGEDAHVEAGVVGKDDGAFQPLGDFVPEVGEWFFACHVFGVDAVDFHAAGVKFQCEGADEVVPFIDDLTPVAYDDAQGAGVGGAPVGGFKVDGRVFHRFSFRWKR